MAKLRKNPPSDLTSYAGPSQSNVSGRPSMSNGSSMGPWHRRSSGYFNSEFYSRPVSSAISRTMSYARGQAEPTAKLVTNSYPEVGQLTRRPATAVAPDTQSLRYIDYLSSSYTSFEPVPTPKSDAERYWAYRAIVAEVKLAEHKGLRTDELERIKEELRRQSAVDVAHKFHEECVLRLERLAVGLISTIVLITLTLLFRHHGRSEDSSAKRSYRPHLTIPILSPFTSIIEHEDSKLSFRTTAVFLIILGIVAYAAFRHWLHRRPR